MLEQDVASPLPLELRLDDTPYLGCHQGLRISGCLLPFGIYFLLGSVLTQWMPRDGNIMPVLLRGRASWCLVFQNIPIRITCFIDGLGSQYLPLRVSHRYMYPSMDQLAEMLPGVLHQFG